MTLQALKDGTLAAAKCRLSSPPLSPSRSHGTTAVQHAKSNAKAPFKSKLLAAFDSDIAFQGSENFFGAGTSSSEFEAQVKANVSSSYAVTRPTRQALKPKSSSLTVPGRAPSLANKSVVAAKQTVLNSSIVLKDGASANTTNGGAASTLPESEAVAQLYSYKDYTPTPTIVYTRHEDEANDIIETLQGPVGFDMEWRVFYRKGVPPSERRVATIQISDRKIILIVQVSAMKKFPKKVKELIENPTIPKIGANIRNDGQKLLRDYGVTAANLVELGALARHADPSFVSKRNVVSLARMIEEYCDGRVLDKGPVRMSNWECVPLSREQLDYAANDAHCALMAYRRLLEIAASNERTLDPATFSSSISKDDPPPLPKVTTAKALTGPSPAPPAPDSVSSSALAYTDLTGPGGGLPPNVWGAYRLWHEDDLPLHEVCKALRSAENPLAKSTVISYVVRALRTQTTLPYSLERLKALVQLDGGSWVRYREWIRSQEARSLG